MLTRTERVQPVIAGAIEWSVAVAAGKQGGIAGSGSSLLIVTITGAHR